MEYFKSSLVWLFLVWQHIFFSSQFVSDSSSFAFSDLVLSNLRRDCNLLDQMFPLFWAAEGLKGSRWLQGFHPWNLFTWIVQSKNQYDDLQSLAAPLPLHLKELKQACQSDWTGLSSCWLRWWASRRFSSLEVVRNKNRERGSATEKTGKISVPKVSNVFHVSEWVSAG